MAYPNVIYGDYGDEKVAQSAKIGNLPLGQLMILPDGRKFRMARAGSVTALKAGVITSCSSETAGHGNVSGSGLLTSATTTENLAGDEVVYLIAKTAAVVKDEYAGGLLNILGPAASTAYIGRVHKIKANEAASAASIRFKVTLENGDPLKADLKAGTTLCSLRKDPYGEQIVFSPGTIIAPPMGATPTAVSASFYYWAQRGGEASLQQSATVIVVGEPVHCAVSVAGSVTTIAATAATAGGYAAVPVGFALGAAAASEAVLTYLTIE